MNKIREKSEKLKFFGGEILFFHSSSFIYLVTPSVSSILVFSSVCLLQTDD